MALSVYGICTKFPSLLLRTRIVTFAKRFNVDPSKWTCIIITEKLFWTVVTVIFIFLTGRTSLELLQQYRSEPTTSRLSIMFNKTIKLATSTICLPIGDGELDVRQKLDANNTYMSYQGELLNYFERENMSKILFLESKWGAENEALYSALLHITWKYLSTLEEVETVTQMVVVDFAHYAPTEDNRAIDEWNAATFLENQMQKINVSVDELRQKFGVELSSVYTADVVQYVERSGALLPIHLVSAEVSYVSETQVCYQILSLMEPFRSKNEYIWISVDRNSLPNLDEKIAERPILVALSASNDILASNVGKSDSVIKGKFGTRYQYSVSIGAVYRALDVVSGEHRCSNNVTEDACRYPIFTFVSDHRCSRPHCNYNI